MPFGGTGGEVLLPAGGDGGGLPGGGDGGGLPGRGDGGGFAEGGRLCAIDDDASSTAIANIN